MTQKRPGRERPAPQADDAQWWRQAVVYQIYPRSFADSNGDGLGDLAGITSRVPYLASLGVDAVWLSPFYPSALADGGYDVDDYRDVDPRLGTLADFDAMVAALHEAGIHVIVDIVPNHSSNRHRWFRAALAAPPGSAARDRYFFRDGTGPGGSRPPSDWPSIFGGPAWTRVPDGQWYLHIFAPEQPDLNWDNADVRADFLTTLRFWSDRGVDGFRVDAAIHVGKDLSEPLAAWADLPDPLLPHGAHPFADRDAVHEIYAEWRRVLDEYDPPRFAVAEVFAHPSRRIRYAETSGLGQIFNFAMLEAAWDAQQFRSVITESLAEAELTGKPTNWVLSNHDVVRHASRYGLPQDLAKPLRPSREWVRVDGSSPVLDVDLGSRRARAATLLALALPGSAYLYQGEELGLHEVPDLPVEVLQDPAFVRSRGREKGRDGCRVPLPWTSSGPSFGFGDDDAHLPQPSWFGRYSVAAEDADPDSSLNLYRRALAARRDLQAAEELRWLDDGPDVVHAVRPGGWHCVMNTGSRAAALPAGPVVVSSGPLAGGALPPDTTAWVVVDD